MKSNILKLSSRTAFVVSAIFTTKLMLSGTIGIFNSILIILMSIIFEFSKCFFLYKSIETQTNISNVIKGISVVITVFLFGVSVLASLSFLQNETNDIKNKSITKSDAYKLQLVAKEQLKDLYDTKKRQISTLQEQTQKQIEALSQQRDNMPSNYLTKKAEINNQISTLHSETNTNISNINAELDKISQEQAKEINIKSVELYSTKGYTAFLKVIADILSSEDNIVATEQLEVILFSLIAIAFELVAVLLYYYNKRESLAVAGVHENYIIKNDIVVDADAGAGAKTKGIIPLRKNTSIGFKHEDKPQDFTNEELNKYITYMNETAINGISKGYQSIAKNINITKNSASKIKGHLEHSGILKTIGNKTVIVKPIECN